MVIFLVAAAATVVALRPQRVQELLGLSKPVEPPTFEAPAPRPVLEPGDQADPPTPEGVAAAIEELVADSRVGRFAFSIVDLPTGQQLYERDARVGMTPASVTKVVTAAAVLAATGPDHRIPTRAVRGSEPGEVVLVGGGDPTLAVDDEGTYPGAARLDELAKQVTEKLAGEKPTKVVVDASVFVGDTTGPGWDSDIVAYGYGGHITGLMINGGRIDPKQTARSPDPALAAGKAFAALLGVPEESVTVGTAPEGAEELGVVESPPMIRLVEIMLAESDNVIAEALGRQVAIARGVEASFTGATTATAETIAELGVATDELVLSDNSGLSRQNRLSPGLLTSLFTIAATDEHPELAGLFSGLPVAGYNGTLDDRYRSDTTRVGAGLVRAKTGTLSGVSTLSGVVVDADGRLLGFALMANDVPQGTAAAEEVLDQIAAKLASCGCR